MIPARLEREGGWGGRASGLGAAVPLGMSPLLSGLKGGGEERKS